jgi:hypothetical protein
VLLPGDVIKDSGNCWKLQTVSWRLKKAGARILDAVYELVPGMRFLQSSG